MLMNINDDEIQLEIKNQNLYQMGEIRNDQRRAPSKSVYESALSKNVSKLALGNK